ncbi:MAG: helicase [Rhizobiales bacterium]|nr:helicase [Hyphomicrobiales bacterium]
MAISFSSPSNRDARARGTGVTAVLGPTNTGKTHLAIERMLAHSSGMIGLPLRLLAREVYNKCIERVGPENVALVTGEEKIKPANPRFWVATVEAMPRDIDVAFVAIDEVQLGADLERGHVFTDRMLNQRGREETLVLGAATVRPMVERLLPGAHVLTRPRLSQLTFAGEKKLTRLPRRSAVVAFSAEEVYAIAELIRRQRGGAAVVLGGLSPRTRNAQVALYQSGDVEYMVATDAIGMGLNLDIDHLAFAADRKFDGYQFRKLNPSELAQIAGRAGRATRDGTFGTTGRCPPFDTEIVQALESHSFEPLKQLQWRNTALDFMSVGALQASLSEVPKENGLTRAPVAEDILVLDHASRDEDVRDMATTPEAVARLWEVCQVPDYRKISPASHAELAMTLFGFLMREGKVPTDWFAKQVDEADRDDGDIDTLSNRIAHIRTWTFAANRLDWLADPEHWQERTRAVEDKLSDALHERLTERFVDRRTSVLMRRMRENTALETDIAKTGEVVVEGHKLGRLDGFSFTPEASAAGSEAKALAGAAQKALAGEIDARAGRLARANDDQFVLATDGIIRWQGQPVGRIVAAEEALKPRVRIIADEQLTGAPRDNVQARLDAWLKAHVEKLLGPLFQLANAEDVTGLARGIAFQLAESLGVIERGKIADDVKSLDQTARASLRKYGVRFGAYHIYVPALLKPAPRVLATQLSALKQEDSGSKGLDVILQLAASGRTSIAADKTIAHELYRIAGFRVCGERAVRVDILERLADIIRPALAWRPGAPGPRPAATADRFGFTVTTAMTSLAGCSGEDFASVLRALGYRMEKRPKPPPEPAVETPAVEMAVADVGADATAPAESTPAETAPVEAVSADAVGTEAPVTDAAAVDVTPLVADVAPEAAQAVDTPNMEATEAAETPAESAPPAAEASAAAPSEPSVEQAAAPAQAEQEFIEVWRPGRPEGQRPRGPRPQHDAKGRHEGRHEAPRGPRRPRHAPQAAAAANGAPASAEGVAAAAAGVPAEGAPASEQARPWRRDDRKGRDHERRDDGRHERGTRPQSPGRPQRDDRSGGRPQRGERPPRSDRPDRDPELRAKYIKGRDGRERREQQQADPNSPFAKLAALKAQLESNKEPS